jgi:hypothetical protein
MKRVYALLLVAVVTSGCIATPFGKPPKQEHPVEFVAENSANTTYTFEVFLVETPANITVRISDGRVYTDDIDPGVVNSDPGDNRTYTAVEVPDTARFHGRFTLKPGESKQTSVKNLPRNFALVVSVYRGNNEHEIIGYITASDCDELALAKLRVTSHLSDSERWISATYACV